MSVAREVSHALADRIDSLCETLLPAGRRESGSWRVGSLSGERGDSLSVKLRQKPGQWKDFATGEKGDALNLVKGALGCDMAEALRWSRQWLGIEQGPTNARWRPPMGNEARRRRDAERAAREASEREEDARKAKRAVATWNEALPIAGTDGEAHLARRGIGLDDVPDHGGLRWHPSCPWQSGTTPCAIARFSDSITAEPRGIWRRPVEGGKPKSLGPTAGCVIRLWPDDCVEQGLVLGEGVETTLAAATRIMHQGTYLQPAWAAGSADSMASFPVLAGIGALTLLVDHDENGRGERAAEQCARRWRDAGKEVIRLMPGELGDFNDLVKP